MLSFTLIFYSTRYVKNILIELFKIVINTVETENAKILGADCLFSYLFLLVVTWPIMQSVVFKEFKIQPHTITHGALES